jgi:hypothetical protein
MNAAFYYNTLLSTGFDCTCSASGEPAVAVAYRPPDGELQRSANLKGRSTEKS